MPRCEMLNKMHREIVQWKWLYKIFNAKWNKEFFTFYAFANILHQRTKSGWSAQIVNLLLSVCETNCQEGYNKKIPQLVSSHKIIHHAQVFVTEKGVILFPIDIRLCGGSDWFHGVLGVHKKLSRKIGAVRGHVIGMKLYTCDVEVLYKNITPNIYCSHTGWL